MERLFHHEHHHGSKDGKQPEGQMPAGQMPAGGNAAMAEQAKPQQAKKEGEFAKFEDYVKKDEELEQEGDTYGGLM